jgi:hypothetical protein
LPPFILKLIVGESRTFRVVCQTASGSTSMTVADAGTFDVTSTNLFSPEPVAEGSLIDPNGGPITEGLVESPWAQVTGLSPGTATMDLRVSCPGLFDPTSGIGLAPHIWITATGTVIVTGPNQVQGKAPKDVDLTLAVGQSTFVEAACLDSDGDPVDTTIGLFNNSAPQVADAQRVIGADGQPSGFDITGLQKSPPRARIAALVSCPDAGIWDNLWIIWVTVVAERTTGRPADGSEGPNNAVDDPWPDPEPSNPGTPEPIETELTELTLTGEVTPPSEHPAPPPSECTECAPEVDPHQPVPPVEPQPPTCQDPSSTDCESGKPPVAPCDPLTDPTCGGHRP